MEPTSCKTAKTTIDFCIKGQFKSVSCCRFPFCYSGKNKDRLRECNKKQGTYIGKLDA